MWSSNTILSCMRNENQPRYSFKIGEKGEAEAWTVPWDNWIEGAEATTERWYSRVH